ncbi:MAG TPA: NUDIX domain-containing protein [Armatimonadota bacterium]|nr:NUDIX domain-containing protein [Armatimonadota bacterium]
MVIPVKARVTGILIEDGKILLVKQVVSRERGWSLPGGRVEEGETLEEGLLREMNEETSLTTKIVKLLYLCEKPEEDPPLLHITFLLERVSGDIRLPSNEFDDNPISDVKMIPISDLTSYGFSARFVNIVKNRFPDAGSYKGHKRNIGL